MWADITIRNQNGFWFLDDAGAFQVAVYLSSDATIGNAGDTLLGTATFSGLGAGQTTSRTMLLSVPNSDPYQDDNDYCIGMVIDYLGQVAESNESNNSNRGNGLDKEQVWFEEHVSRPANPNYPDAEPLGAGQSLSRAIGDERIGVLDIDVYSYVTPNNGTPQTVVFDLDGGGWSSNLRLYLGNWIQIAQNSGGAAPGEQTGTGESLIRYTLNPHTQYYLVVAAVGNHNADARVLSGRQAASQGNYVINAVVLPNAPSAPDLNTASDSGYSGTDNITNASSLNFRFSGQPSKIGQVYVDGVLRGQANGDASGFYSISVSGLSDGSHSVTTALMDPGNSFVSDFSAALTVITDRTAPAAPAPDLAADSDGGLSNADDITNDFTPTFTGATEANAFVQLFASGYIDAGSSSSTGAWSITPSFNTDGNYEITIRVTDRAGNVSTISPALAITLDTTAPTFTTPMHFHYDTAPQRVTMEFTDDVIATISSADLTVLDLATSGTVGVTLAYDQPQHAATFTFAAGVLAAGNYQATISGVSDVAGNQVAGETTLSFFFMPGDANHDRTVDVSDLGILASNWQGAGKTFSQGDFNYDGKVDVGDLGILASNWQGTLLPAASASAASKRILSMCNV
jgi:hypothetical protein